MPAPKLKKADVENKKLKVSGSTVVFVQRDPSGPAYNNGHKVRATSGAGCVWRGPVTGNHSGETWKAVVTFESGPCDTIGTTSASAQAKYDDDPDPAGGGGGTEDISVTVTNPGGETSNAEIATQVEIVP